MTAVSAEELQSDVQAWLARNGLRPLRFFAPGEYQGKYCRDAAVHASMLDSELCGVLGGPWTAPSADDAAGGALYRDWVRFVDERGYGFALGYVYTVHFYPHADRAGPQPPATVGGRA